ncbi:hypothetical protein [Streptomyces sp. NPDC058751]|uniref:hypothetical protein n=1 Tax=Streptomyces sp. NPDC058751 TaxID=3346623 RepID=UPI00368953ED
MQPKRLPQRVQANRVRKEWKEHFSDYDERLGYAAVAPDAATKGMNMVISALQRDRRVTRPKTMHRCVTNTGATGSIQVPSVIQLGLTELARHLRAKYRHAGHQRHPDVSVMSSVCSVHQVSGSDEITEPGTWWCSTGDDKSVEITWTPTTDVGTNSLLTVRRGMFITGRDERMWEEKRALEIAVPFGSVWALNKNGEAA